MALWSKEQAKFDVPIGIVPIEHVVPRVEPQVGTLQRKDLLLRCDRLLRLL